MRALTVVDVPSDDEETRPTAFISYAQGAQEWQRDVLRLTTGLRQIGGVEAEMDLYHASDHQQWTTFGPRLMESSDFVLVGPNHVLMRHDTLSFDRRFYTFGGAPSERWTAIVGRDANVTSAAPPGP